MSFFATALPVLMRQGNYSLFAIALILYYLRHYPERHPLFTVSLAGICAGALGNMIDRVRLGEVIDFFDVFIGRAHWPAFNVADSAITLGAIGLFTPSCRITKRNRPEVNPPDRLSMTPFPA